MNLPRVICTTVLVETSPQAMPLGAACIASAVKADEKTRGMFDVELCDFSREDKAFEDAESRGGDGEVAKLIAGWLAGRSAPAVLNAAVQNCAPAVVCFSIYVWNRNVLSLAAVELHRLLPKIICIAGGPEATADPFSFSDFDYIIAGQGEVAMPALLSSLFLEKNISAASAIPGVYVNGIDYSNEKKSIVRAPACMPEKLSSPYLDGTLDPAKYGGALWELARGCPFKCSYCYESKGEKRIQYFPEQRLEKELELFAEKNIAQVFVLDPTYNADKKRAAQIIKKIAQKAPGMFFYFEARAEFIDMELAKAFASIPCSLQIGLQSADEKVLANVHRTLDKKFFVRNIGYLNETGAVFGFDLIYGLPGDTLAGFKHSIDFALSLYPNNIELFCLSVLPGTTLHDDADGFGLKWQHTPPYHVLCTPTFSEADIARAESLARSVNIFYTQGRAVPWFNAALNPLHIRASAFFEEFEKYLNGVEKNNKSDCGLVGKNSKNIKYSDDEIINIQKEFLKQIYSGYRLEKLIPVVEDIIEMNGAIGKCTADGTESVVHLNYHPDDIMSEYSQDLIFFQQNAKKCRSTVDVFEGKNGVDWKRGH